MSEHDRDELGAHVSARGGVSQAPGRAREIGAGVLQLFTKQPNRWAEPDLADDEVVAFRRAREEYGIACAGSHDSYLINLSSPDPGLWERSVRSFTAELERCTRLGLDFLVTHPGNATDGDLEAGLTRNAEGVASALDAVPDSTRVLLELTAGSGTSVGGRFEHLRAIVDRLPESLRERVGVCVDTCHAYSAGYDWVGDYEAVWAEYERWLSFDQLGLLHLNDSRHPLASHKDRHEIIGEGTLGEEPFRRLMTDGRLSDVPKVLETPKGDDEVTLDRLTLERLRAYRTTT